MRWLLVICVVALATGSAWAERREALVFGAERYRILRGLNNANNDAEAVKAALEGLGFHVALEEDRNLKRMRRALEDFAEDAAGADVALVFFAGHGVEISGENRLLPIDADASSLAALKATSLPLEEVRAVLAAIAPVGLVVLDACRNDPFGAAAGGGRGAVSIGADVKAAARPGLGRVGRAENILFAFSAAPGATAADGTGSNSPFTGALVRHLGTEGLEIRSVLTLVQQDVYDESRGEQLPYVESGLPKTFFAATGREDLSERERLLLAMAEVTPALRDEVERVAGEADMPLAPLYGALIGADLAQLSAVDRGAKLAEAAGAFRATRDELRRLASDDPGVSALRAEAETSLSLGAFGEARAALARAAEIDARSGDALAANLVSRRVSQAATHVAEAGVARAALDYPAAFAAYEKAAALHARIEAEDVPDAARHARIWLLNELGDLRLMTGDTGGARDAFERMRRAAETRYARMPSASAEHDLAVSFSKIGDVEQAQGRLDAALASYRNGLAIDQRLAASDPANAEWQSGLSASLIRLGDVETLQGRFDAALASYRSSLAIGGRLAASDPANAEWQDDLSTSLIRIGDVEAAQGRLDAALASYRSGLAIDERLAASDPANAEWQRGLATSRNRLGDIEVAQGRLDAALASYRSSLAIAQRLAASDGANAEWQHDLSVFFQKIGDVEVAQGRLDGALASYRSSLAITEKLAASDPTNAFWQRDLIVAHLKLVQAGGERRRHLESALDVALAMQKAGILAPSDASVINVLREKLNAPPPAE